MKSIVTSISAALFFVSLHASPVLGDSRVDAAKNNADVPALHSLATPVIVRTDGEVRKVDKTGATVTIKHGRIENLDMPAMTMVFTAASPGLLDKLNVGDKVRFHAEFPAGKLVVTEIVRVP